jgi:hypothetical protein
MIITGAKLSGVNIVSPTGTFIGSTASTQIPTLTGFTTVAASPFATGSPYGGINTQAITNQCTLLIQP